METPEEKKMLDEATYEAGMKAKAEAQMVSTQAQRLFYEYWNAGGFEKPMKESIDQFKKCMQMADKIREIVQSDFKKRIKEFDSDISDRYKKAGLVPPSASLWSTWRPASMGGD